MAIPSRMSAHYILLNQLLKDKGLTIDDVQWVEMPPPDMPAALAHGDIKGYLVGEPFGAKAVLGGYGKMLLRTQDLWPNWICCGLVMSPETIKAYPEATQEFVDSLVAAGNYIENNRGEAIKIAQDYMKIDEKIWAKSFEWGISYADLKPTQEDLQKLQTNLAALKLLKGTVKTDKMLNDTFVTKAYDP